MNATATVTYDWYELLGIPPHASPDEVRRAYCAAAKRHHPDAGGDPSGRAFQTIHEAYSLLSDPARRRAYDRQRRTKSEPAQSRPRGSTGRARPAEWTACSTPPPGPAYQQPPPPRHRPRRSTARRLGSVAAIFLCIGMGILLLTVSAAGAKDLASRNAHDPWFSEATLGPTDLNGRPISTDGLFAYASPLTADGHSGDATAGQALRQQISASAPFNVPDGGFQKDALQYQM